MIQDGEKDFQLLQNLFMKMNNINKKPLHFPMTGDGYKKALQWLKDYNYENLIEKELSTDGFTIVALANFLYKKDKE